MNKQLMGVVMCGGQSKRMGNDKGMLVQHGKTWAETAVVKLKGLSIPVIISINHMQVEVYQKVFDQNQLVVDSLHIGGPMNGLLSIHAAYPNDDLLLLACDMIDMNDDLLKELVRVYLANPAFDYYAYVAADVVQPFCAIYTAAALSVLMQKYQQQMLASSSPRFILEQGKTYKIQTDNNTPFTNYNTLDEPNAKAK